MKILKTLEKFKTPIKWTIGVFILVGIFSAIFLPAPSGYPPRVKVSGMIMAASEIKSEIELKLKKGESISDINTLHFKESKYISYGKVSNDGEIVLFNEEIGAIVILTPKLKDNEVIWVCKVKPNKYAPMACKEKNS